MPKNVDQTAQSLLLLADMSLGSVDSTSQLGPIINWAHRLGENRKLVLLKLAKGIADGHPAISGGKAATSGSEPSYRRAQLLRAITTPEEIIDFGWKDNFETISPGEIIYAASELDVHRPDRNQNGRDVSAFAVDLLVQSKTSDQFLKMVASASIFLGEIGEGEQLKLAAAALLEVFVYRLNASQFQILEFCSITGWKDLSPALSWLALIRNLETSSGFVDASERLIEQSGPHDLPLVRNLVLQNTQKFLRLWNGRSVSEILRLRLRCLPQDWTTRAFLQLAFAQIDTIQDLHEFLKPQTAHEVNSDWHELYHHVFLNNPNQYIKVIKNNYDLQWARDHLKKKFYLMGERHRLLNQAPTAKSFLSILQNNSFIISSAEEPPIHNWNTTIIEQDLKRFIAMHPSIEDFREALELTRNYLGLSVGIELITSRSDFFKFHRPYKNLSLSFAWQAEAIIRSVQSFVTLRSDAGLLISEQDIDQLFAETGLLEYGRDRIPALSR